MNYPKLANSEIIILAMLSRRPLSGSQVWEIFLTERLSLWSHLSRPVIYKSLTKLFKSGLLEIAVDNERLFKNIKMKHFRCSSKGKMALEQVLNKDICKLGTNEVFLWRRLYEICGLNIKIDTNKLTSAHKERLKATLESRVLEIEKQIEWLKTI